MASEGISALLPSLTDAQMAVVVGRGTRHVTTSGEVLYQAGDRGYDFIKKAALYATFGVREYWSVDTDAETIFVQVLRDNLYIPLVFEDGIVRSEVLPGFEIDPKGLFAMPEWMTDGADDVE